MKSFSKVFLILSIIFESLAFVFFVLVFIADVVNDNASGWILFISIALIPLLWLVISAVTLKRIINGRVKAISTSMIMMKLTVFFIMFAIGFLAIKDGIYASALFGFIGFFSGISVLISAKLRSISDNGLNENRYQFKGYNAGNHWYFAAVEFLRKNSRDISELENMMKEIGKQGEEYEKYHSRALPYEDRVKITEYACMPIIYLLQWLIENNHMSELFTKRFKPDDIANVRSGFIPVMYFFRNAMQCKVDRWDISDKIQNFLVWYYEPFTDIGCYRRSNDSYLFDYCTIIQSKGADLYYCDYHYDIYRELKEIIDKRYEEYLEFVERDRKFVSEYNKTGTVLNWQLFNKNLEIYANHELTTEEIENCQSALNGLNEGQIKQLERMIIRKLALSTPIDFRSDIIPESVHIHEAENNDVYFSVGCGISIDENKIIGFTVKNGVIVNMTYDYEFDMPYCNYENEQYELGNNDIDFLSLTEQAAVDELCRSGKLKAVEIKMDGMELNSDNGMSNIIYITPAAEKIFNENIRRLSILHRAHLINDVNIACTRGENSIVPQIIYFAGLINTPPSPENPDNKPKRRYSDVLNIWN